jgi:hypothetical protein
VLTWQIIFVAEKPVWVTYVISLIFLALYGYGVFIGVCLAERGEPIWSLLFYFTVQIPFISSPLVTYRFYSGLEATVAIRDVGVGWDARFGSEWRLAILSSAPLGFGINIVAIIIVFFLTSLAFQRTRRGSGNSRSLKGEKKSDLNI